jgi:hypothetical protein
MPFPLPYLRHTLLWSLPGGEVATSSCSWAVAPGGVISTPTEEADALEAKAEALWSTIKGVFAAEVKFQGSRIVWVSVNGTTVETLERTIPDSAGFADNPTLPTEVATVVSLVTGTYSRSGRGRMYLPPASKVITGGRLGGGECDTLANGMQTYLGHAIVGTNTITSSVASKKDGALRPITNLRVGDVFDAQRRRRDALVEVLHTRTVA